MFHGLIIFIAVTVNPVKLRFQRLLDGLEAALGGHAPSQDRLGCSWNRLGASLSHLNKDTRLTSRLEAALASLESQMLCIKTLLEQAWSYLEAILNPPSWQHLETSWPALERL